MHPNRIAPIDLNDDFFAEVPVLDELNDALGVTKIAWNHRSNSLRIFFGSPLDTFTVAQRYLELDEVQMAHPNRLTGDGSTVLLLQKADQWHFVVRRGWGDCPSGCIHEEFTYFTYDPASGVVTQDGYLSADSPRSGQLALSGIPDRFPLSPFTDFAACLVHASD